jgi:hypothetical protein
MVDRLYGWRNKKMKHKRVSKRWLHDYFGVNLEKLNEDLYEVFGTSNVPIFQFEGGRGTVDQELPDPDSTWIEVYESSSKGYFAISGKGCGDEKMEETEFLEVFKEDFKTAIDSGFCTAESIIEQLQMGACPFKCPSGCKCECEIGVDRPCRLLMHDDWHWMSIYYTSHDSPELREKMLKVIGV